MAKRELYEVWKELNGSKVWWKVQFPKGIMTFRTRKTAMTVADSFKKIPGNSEHFVSMAEARRFAHSKNRKNQS